MDEEAGRRFYGSSHSKKKKGYAPTLLRLNPMTHGWMDGWMAWMHAMGRGAETVFLPDRYDCINVYLRGTASIYLGPVPTTHDIIHKFVVS